MHTLSVTDPDELLSVRLAAVKNDFLWDRTEWLGFGVTLFSLSVGGASSIFIILLKLSATFAMRSWVEVSWLMSVVDMLLRLSSSCRTSKPDSWRIFLSSECFLLGWNLQKIRPEWRKAFLLKVQNILRTRTTYPRSSTSMLLWLGLLRTSMSLSLPIKSTSRSRSELVLPATLRFESHELLGCEMREHEEESLSEPVDPVSMAK